MTLAAALLFEERCAPARIRFDIRRFQYRQTQDNVVLSIVPINAGSEATLTRDLEPILLRARQLLRGTELRLAFVDRIPPSRSGKHRYIINDVSVQPPSSG